MQSIKDHAVYSDFFGSKRKFKAEGYHAICVQYVAVSCCLSAKLRPGILEESEPVQNRNLTWPKWPSQQAKSARLLLFEVTVRV
jgi:hypothetical protein